MNSRHGQRRQATLRAHRSSEKGLLQGLRENANQAATVRLVRDGYI